MIYSYPTDKPLPKLPVTREEFCSQEMTDEIISYIEAKHPWLIEELYEKCQGLSGDYFTSFSKAAHIAHDEASQTIKVPNDPRGYIDLTFELCKRLRTNMELPPFEVVGNPIAPDLGGPYMPLADKEISEQSLTHGFTQATLDELLAQYYADHSDYWYLAGEALRRGQGVYIPDPVPEKYFRELIAEKISPAENYEVWNLTIDFRNEMGDRLRIMCNTPDYL